MKGCKMSNFKSRMEKILAKLQSIPGQFFWILEDGSHVPATGANDPMAFTVYPFPWHDGAPTVCPVAWGYDGPEVDLDPTSASLFEEALNMSGFIKRIESMKKKLNSLVSGATIIYADGSCKTLPVDSMIQEFLWHSAEIERIECDEPGSGLLAELLQGLKDQANVEPLDFPEEEPVTVAPPPAPAETYEGRRAYLEKRQQEITTSKPNPPSDNQHCI